MSAPPGNYDENGEYDSEYDDYDSEYDSEEDYDDDEDGGAPQPEAVILPSGPQAALLATFIQQMPPVHADMEPEHDDPNDATNAGANRRAITKSPPELWMEYMEDVRNGRLKALKITDEGLEWFLDPDSTLPPIEGVPRDATALITQIGQAIEGSPGLTQVIWGRRVWQLASPAQQLAILNALGTRHSSTLTYWKMGTEENGLPLGSPAMTEALLQLWTNGNLQWKLTEIELRGLVFASQQQVDGLANVIRSQLSRTIKQLNILGFFLHPKMLMIDAGSQGAVFDCLIHSITNSCQDLDELRLCRCVTPDSINTAPLIRPEALQDMMKAKPKWWRLGLDGLGLDNRHLQVLSTALKSSPSCKMGDLLSLKENPQLTDYATLINISTCKARMGYIQLDDPSWVATSDLIRSLNNLHRRLDYVVPETGGYPSKSKWIDWLSKISTIPWADDTKMINYLWHTLLEKPEYIQPSKPEQMVEG